MVLANRYLRTAVTLLYIAIAVACTAEAASPPPESMPVVAVTAITDINAATATPRAQPSARPLFRVPTLIPTPTTTPTLTPTPTTTPPARSLPPTEQGIWISAEELATLPVEGEAWERLKETADAPLDEPNLAGYDADHDVQTLAVALVYARTGEPHYGEKAAEAIRAVIGTEYTGYRDGPDSEQGALAVTVGRNLVPLVIAADLINLAEYDPTLDAEFREWIARLLYEEWDDGSLVSEDERRANNHGRVAGASRVAIAAYLGDDEELTRAARVFKGFLGDREAYAGFEFDRDLSWQAVQLRPVGINPAGAVKDGFVIDGALPEEMRRGCPFRVPPCANYYPWGALQGVVVEAHILHRQGFDAWNWEDRAVWRAMAFLHGLQERYPDERWWARGDDMWIPWLVNAVYDADFPVETPSRMGKVMEWTDWTHGSLFAPDLDDDEP